MNATVFKNARMVLPGEVVLGSLQVDGGRIASLDSGATAVLQGIDLGDLRFDPEEIRQRWAASPRMPKQVWKLAAPPVGPQVPELPAAENDKQKS